MKIKKNYKKNQRGFSLIELMVVVIILGFIILGLVTFFTGGIRSWIAGQSQLEAQRNARQAMDRMVREIRKGKNVTGGSATSITVAIPDLEGPESGYSVSYLLSGTTIQRDDNPLINNVYYQIAEPIFKFYNISGNIVHPPNDTVSKVHIDLKVDVDEDNSPDITLNTDVNLRNFGL